MRCNICDTILDVPKYNRQISSFEPCGTCLEEIFSLFPDAPETKDSLVQELIDEGYELDFPEEEEEAPQKETRVWEPHLDYSGEPMHPGEFREGPTPLKENT